MDARYEALYAAVAKQAIRDWRDDYHHPRHMDAGAWLQLAGLLTEEGEIDCRGVSQRRIAAQPTKEDPMTQSTSSLAARLASERVAERVEAQPIRSVDDYRSYMPANRITLPDHLLEEVDEAPLVRGPEDDSELLRPEAHVPRVQTHGSGRQADRLARLGAEWLEDAE